MPTTYVTSLVLAVLAAVVVRLALPVPTRALRAGRVDITLVLIGATGLVFHCGAMFYRSTVGAIPGIHSLVAAVNAMGTASIVAFAIPAAVLLIGLRRSRPWLLALVVAALTAVGVTMYNGSTLDTHLTTIVVAAALIALAATDTFTRRRRAGRTRRERASIRTT